MVNKCPPLSTLGREKVMMSLDYRPGNTDIIMVHYGGTGLAGIELDDMG